jgi:transcriptional regulator GlxA family with amidase domain
MKIAVINYPHALQSAVYGLCELFEMTTLLPQAQFDFNAKILDLTQLKESDVYDIVILPPSVKDDYYLNPCETLLRWLNVQHKQKALLCSACSGAFILAAGGFLNQRKATTHWALAEEFKARFKLVTLETHHILVHEGSIITAGGLMSWLDLGLEIVSQFEGNAVMTQLGKNMVVDTGYRSQSYYQQFMPRRNHGNQAILSVQAYLDENFDQKLKISQLAELSHMSERSLLRHFFKSTGYKPIDYLQRLRIQKACDLLETSNHNFDIVASQVGYEDASACRKLFVRTLGLTPKEFRQRFVRSF